MEAVATMYDPRSFRRAMNHPEAVNRACHLWGWNVGHVEIRHSAPANRRYVVGTKGEEPGRRAFGEGSTWEEAFESAARRGFT